MSNRNILNGRFGQGSLHPACSPSEGAAALDVIVHSFVANLHTESNATGIPNRVLQSLLPSENGAHIHPALGHVLNTHFRMPGWVSIVKIAEGLGDHSSQ